MSSYAYDNMPEFRETFLKCTQCLQYTILLMLGLRDTDSIDTTHEKCVAQYTIFNVKFPVHIR